jgi:hypothetical protein
MDEIDKLQAHEEILHRAHLEQSRRDTGDAIATGACLFCEEPLPHRHALVRGGMAG